jgi:hypothetical protein
MLYASSSDSRERFTNRGDGIKHKSKSKLKNKNKIK